jgi:hypothetical protein
MLGIVELVKLGQVGLKIIASCERWALASLQGVILSRALAR